MNTKHNLNIAIIDDDKMFTELMRNEITHTLSEFNVEIDTYQVGELFLTKISNKMPDLILLDVHLNSKYKDAMGGFKVLEKIKETHPKANVLIISGQSHLRNELDAIAKGAIAYVRKDQKMNLNLSSHMVNVGHTSEIKKEWLHFKKALQLSIAFVSVIALASLVYLTLS